MVVNRKGEEKWEVVEEAAEEKILVQEIPISCSRNMIKKKKSCFSFFTVQTKAKPRVILNYQDTFQ